MTKFENVEDLLAHRLYIYKEMLVYVNGFSVSEKTGSPITVYNNTLNTNYGVAVINSSEFIKHAQLIEASEINDIINKLQFVQNNF